MGREGKEMEGEDTQEFLLNVIEMRCRNTLTYLLEN
jgi:hypothetical protein